jgi:murein DD-endopeptidase MepM/ murein hydrolase activator NlpD
LLSRLAHRLDHALEAHLPEQRLFLKSDSGTRFIRLRPSTQAMAIGVFCLALGWMMFASALVLMGAVVSGNRSADYARQIALYESRLTAVSQERDARAAEAASAQDRFNLALAQVSNMQGMLLAAEDRSRELQTGIDVIQATLRRVIKERDAARAGMEALNAAIQGKPGAASELGRAADVEATVAFLSRALTDLAKDRDALAEDVTRAEERTAAIAKEKRALESRDAMIFARLDDALTVSIEPLNKMFRDLGLDPDSLIAAVRKGYSGEGGPLTPISLALPNQAPSPEELHANAILAGLDRLNLYRLAAFQIPLGLPLHTRFRYTSPFGSRDDPLGAGERMHEGQDLAGAYGSPVYATADGVVIYAGWESGYGRLIRIRHAYGLETRYGHLSQIRVSVGDRVSRGDRIGDMGNSGRSTGTHLHYEVRIDGRAVNPMAFIRAANHVF